jgi:hypothetical protein
VGEVPSPTRLSPLSPGGGLRLNLVIPGRPEGPGPESITTILTAWIRTRQIERTVVMDSGLLASLGPGMTKPYIPHATARALPLVRLR